MTTSWCMGAEMVFLGNLSSKSDTRLNVIIFGTLVSSIFTKFKYCILHK